ncbi:MAG: transglycosylase domain-containing protein [Gaiellaceae bacterium]
MSPSPRFRRPELVPGQRRRQRRRVERARRRRRTLVVLLIVTLVLGAAVAASFGGAAAMLDNCSLSSLRQISKGQKSFVYDGKGVFLAAIPSTRNRQPVGLENVSPWLRKATIAIEDRRFYQHGGVDWEGILRAAVRDIEEGRAVEGASTITQQLVRNLYPISNERTLDRKVKEACLAIKLSRKYSKDWILAQYLNAVYYGNHAYGVKAAARTYYDTSVSTLNPAQAAMLAGLTQAPSIYDPFVRPDTALARRNDVLRAMLSNGDLTRYQYGLAVNSPLNLRDGRGLYDIQRVAPRDRYFFNYVYDELVAQYGASTVRSGGLRVYTTMQPRLQKAAVQSIRGQLNRRSDPAAAVVSIDPRTGWIKAMTAEIPSRRQNDFNLASQARRQAGSTFKTFVLATAIRQGIDPSSTHYLSSPFDYQPDPLSPPWEVSTYDHSYSGSISIESATLKSDNTVYARLTLDVGPENVARTAHALGIRTPLPPYPSMGLGSIDVSPLEMASAYATLAAGGVYSEPTGIRKVLINGKDDPDAGWGIPARQHVIPDWVAAEVTRVLGENIESGTGTAAYFGKPAAGKTGTTSDHADAWFCGYTPTLSTSIWVGYLSWNKPMLDVHGISVAGGTFPAMIWHDYMTKATAGLPYREFAQPRGTPVWRDDYRGQYQYDGSYYDPYSASDSSSEETTTSTTAATTTPVTPQVEQRTPPPAQRTPPRRTTPVTTTPATPPPVVPPPRREPPPTD